MQTKVYIFGVSGVSEAAVDDSKQFLLHQVLLRQNSMAISADSRRTSPTAPWSICRHGKGPCKEDAVLKVSVGAMHLLEGSEALKFASHKFTFC